MKIKYYWITILFTSLFTSNLISQNDTIVTKNGKTILGEIINVDSISIFYIPKGYVTLCKENPKYINDYSEKINRSKVFYFNKQSQQSISNSKINQPISYSSKTNLQKSRTAFILAGLALMGRGIIELEEQNNTSLTPNGYKNLSNSASACIIFAGLSMTVGVAFHFK